ncbi:hypothetical protein YC2023_091686 [Brassica napus]
MLQFNPNRTSSLHPTIGLKTPLGSEPKWLTNSDTTCHSSFHYSNSSTLIYGVLNGYNSTSSAYSVRNVLTSGFSRAALLLILDAVEILSAAFEFTTKGILQEAVKYQFWCVGDPQEKPHGVRRYSQLVRGPRFGSKVTYTESVLVRNRANTQQLRILSLEVRPNTIVFSRLFDCGLSGAGQAHKELNQINDEHLLASRDMRC